jgi:arsenite methyltransferase
MDVKIVPLTLPHTTEESVYARYAEAANAVEPSLCCPVTYDPRFLARLPQEILDRDYGCGDPSAFVREGETVLDLGSGGGKICYIAAQIVGPGGRVIGVDCNQEMLALARKYQAQMAETLGYANVEFRAGLIQDLALDIEQLSEQLGTSPVQNHDDWLRLRQHEERLRKESPLIADDSIDVAVSNCVLNLVRPSDRRQLFTELFRVLKAGGRAAISDIVCDEDVPAHLRDDPDLWSGCIAGAFREDEFVRAFEDAGFHGMTIVNRQSEPWRVVEGIEFRAITVLAWKGKQGLCWERNQAVVYKGPFKSVIDDDGHVFRRGERMAVCEKLFRIVQQEPYAGMFELIEPRVEISPEQRIPFVCDPLPIRSPRETKGADYRTTSQDASDCCTPGESCC